MLKELLLGVAVFEEGAELEDEVAIAAEECKLLVLLLQ